MAHISVKQDPYDPPPAAVASVPPSDKALARARQANPKMENDADEGGKAKETVYTIPSDVLFALIHFYDTESRVVGRCRDLLKGRTFPSLARLTVRWALVLRNRQPGVGKAALLFNTASFLEQLVHMLTRAQDYLDATQAVVFWVRRGHAVDEWWRDAIRHAKGDSVWPVVMPYGVLEATDYDLELRPRSRYDAQLEAHAVLHLATRDDEPEFHRRFELVVVAPGLQMIHCTPAQLQQSSAYRLGVSQDRSNPAPHAPMVQTPWTQWTRRPNSRLYQIMKEFTVMRHAEDNLRHADFNRTHPIILLQARDPPRSADGPISPIDVPQNKIYSSGSLQGAFHAMRLEQARMTLYEANDQLERMRLAAGGARAVFGSGGEQGKSQRTMVREAQQVPDALDDQFMFPLTSQVARADPAMPVDNAASVAAAYAAFVANVFEVPGVFLTDAFGAPAGVGGAAGTHFNRDQTALGLLDETVQRRRAAAVTLFERVHAATFAMYEMDMLDAAAAMLIAEEEEEPAEEGELPSDVLVRARALRAYVDTARQRGKEALGSHATLEFAPEPTERKKEKLEYLTGLAATGMVSAAVLEKAVREVYDGDIRLREPPEPPAPAGGSGGKKKKKTAAKPKAKAKPKPAAKPVAKKRAHDTDERHLDRAPEKKRPRLGDR